MNRNGVNRSLPPAARLLGMVGLAMCVQLAGNSAGMAAGPFAGFTGSWSGEGNVIFANGASERIRCRSQYRTANADNNLQQTLRCASASYQFQLDSEITHANGRLSGVWTEKTNDVSGRVSGEAAPGQIRAVVSGSGFSASVAVTLSANSQAVRIRPQGERVAEVSIEMRRN